jgi:hypothetical protein
VLVAVLERAAVQVRGEPCKRAAQPEPQDSPQPTRVKKKDPERRNLKLDELKSWLEDVKREQAGGEENAL